MSHNNKFEFRVEGMTCASCEFLIEERLKDVAGVNNVKAHLRNGLVEIWAIEKPKLEKLRAALSEDEYIIMDEAEAMEERKLVSKVKNSGKDYMEIGAMTLVMFGLYLFLKQTGILDSALGISDNMSYGLIFLIGLVAASSSCIAVAGGVLLSMAARYNEMYSAETRLEKFKPHLFFNIGRIVSYTLLGGLLGSLGSVFTVSTKTTAIISIVASLFMIVMGLKTLKLFPGLKMLSWGMPKGLGHKIVGMEKKRNKAVPFFVGAATFFLPCGFTQALQLYAISQGSFTEGALIMFFFALGTLPALMSLSAVSAFAKGTFQRYFLKFSGVLVLIFGIFNISNGLALLGFDTWSLAGQTKVESSQKIVESTYNNEDKDANKVIDEKEKYEILGITGEKVERDDNTSEKAPVVTDSKQVVEMKVDGFHYTPDEFTVKVGVPVEWVVDGSEASGCAQSITIPDLDIIELLKSEGKTIITFTPEEAGEYYFTCSMGMTPPGVFKVVK